MENTTKIKRVLIGIDGSVQSLNAASYASEILSPNKTMVTLFYVDMGITDFNFDIEDKPDVSEWEKTSYEDWRKKHREKVNVQFEKIKKLFTNRGFDPGKINYIQQQLIIGVTRDIIEESRKNYDLLIIGKTGSRSVIGIPLGSVTEKLLSHVFHIPLVVVEGRPETGKMLLGFDNSHGAVSAVKNLVPFVGTDKKIMLCHVLRSMGLMGIGHYNFAPIVSDWDEFPDVESERISSQKKKIDKSMEKQKKWMICSGINKDDITTCILEGYMSRSQGLVEKVRKEGYGTLVLGRRGHSAVMEFFMGRVGRKAIQIGNTIAVWIMN